MLFHPRLVAQFLYWSSRTGSHVVPQTEGVSHFVRRNETDELSHQFFVKFLFVSARVDSSSLHHIPVVYQLHHVVIPADVTFNNFTGARIVHIGTIGVGNGRCKIANHRETCVFKAHVGTIFRPFLGDNRIFETCLFKGFLPIFHTKDEIFHPLFGGCRVDVVDDGLLGFYQFPTFHLFDVFFLGFETPARNDRTAFHLLLLVVELHKVVGEITHTRVESAAAHQVFGKKYKRGVQTQGDESSDGSRRYFVGLCAEGFHCLDFGVDGEGLHCVDIRQIAAKTADVESSFAIGFKTRHWIVAFQEIGDFDTILLEFGGGVGECFFDFEGCDNGIFCTGFHRLPNALGTIG